MHLLLLVRDPFEFLGSDEAVLRIDVDDRHLSAELVRRLGDELALVLKVLAVLLGKVGTQLGRRNEAFGLDVGQRLVVVAVGVGVRAAESRLPGNDVFWPARFPVGGRRRHSERGHGEGGGHRGRPVPHPLCQVLSVRKVQRRAGQRCRAPRLR